MKAANAFAITLAIIIAFGGGFILGAKFTGGEDVTVSSIVSDASVKVKDSVATATGKGSSSGTNASEDTSSTKSSKKSSANPVKKAIVSKAIDTYIDSSSGQAKEIAESMSEADKEAVTEIIAENVSIDAVADMQSYVANGDSASLMNYAKENFSEEDYQKLESIMSKYYTAP